MDATSTVVGLLEGSEFRRGLLCGAVAAVVLLVGGRLRYFWGLAWTIAGVVALYWAGGPVVDAMLWGAGAAPWVPASLAAAAFVAAAGVASPSPSSLPGLAMIVTVTGIWATIPDTEAVSVLLGVTAGLVWLWWPLGLASPGRLGALAIAFLVAVVTAAGSFTRPAALIGGIGTLASLVVLARPIGSSPLVTSLLHIGLVVTWSQLAGRADTATAALSLGVAVSALLILLAAADERRHIISIESKDRV